LPAKTGEGEIMQLVIRRYRERKGASNFRINARMIIDQAETSLIDTYNLRKITLTESNPQRDLLKAFVPAIIISFLLAVLVAVPISSPVAGVILFLLALFVSTALIYQQIREEVRVNDLLTGRDFKARSLIALLEKEFEIRKMSDVFAKVVDQSRTWEEPEIIELAPQPLFTILRGDSHATP